MIYGLRQNTEDGRWMLSAVEEEEQQNEMFGMRWDHLAMADPAGGMPPRRQEEGCGG